jgi:hypothetical protein
MRNGVKPAAFDPHSRTESQSPLVVRGKAARSVEVLLSAIQTAVRNSLSSVKNGTEHRTPGTPFSDRHVAIGNCCAGPAGTFQNIV